MSVHDTDIDLKENLAYDKHQFHVRWLWPAQTN